MNKNILINLQIAWLNIVRNRKSRIFNLEYKAKSEVFFIQLFNFYIIQ